VSGPPLAVLDLIPVSEGATTAEAVRNSLDLVQHAERLGFHRYWFAEHHLNPGVVGISPSVAISLVASSTKRIRLGSAGVQMGHRTPLSVVEEFGLISALHPGRIDLGLGRSIGRSEPADGAGEGDGVTAAVQAMAPHSARAGGSAHAADERTDNGLLLPRRFDRSKMAGSPRLRLSLSLLQQPGAYTPPYSAQIAELQALLDGSFRSEDGLVARASPGERADIELWILGASGGESAEVAGSRGLRFAASYHHSPSTVLDAVEAYRAAFRPSGELAQPYVSVSADVVVGEDEASAARLAAGYGLWVRSIRTGAGAIPFPPPEVAEAHAWSDEDRALVQDRLDTQLVGTAETVADKLEQLREATGADELAITTITHQHSDRIRSYELLAGEWRRRHAAAPSAAADRR
jgi:alkanesulfonate monooxygenase SsuD/methylene tetrahydromethanopterin reductase-like flavin-dependent oxidoreductase (luciferase family)